MATQVRNVNKVKSGMCPHGLPPGACPICSNMGGGGSTRVGERAQKAGEMSYHECAMIGNMLRAQKLARKNHIKNLENRTEALKAFENSLTKLAEKLSALVKHMQKSLLLKPIAFAIQNLVVPIINFVKNIPTLISNFMDRLATIKNKFIDIMDKLAAVFGEAKLFIQKKLSNLFSAIKNKLRSIFKVFKKNNTDDDDTKIDDDKKIFNLKNILQKLVRKKKDDDNSQNKQ